MARKSAQDEHEAPSTVIGTRSEQVRWTGKNQTVAEGRATWLTGHIAHDRAEVLGARHEGAALLDQQRHGLLSEPCRGRTHGEAVRAPAMDTGGNFIVRSNFRYGELHSAGQQ